MLILSIFSIALISSLAATIFVPSGGLPYKIVPSPIKIQLPAKEVFERDLRRIMVNYALNAERAAEVDGLAARMRAASQRLTAPARLADFMASDSMEIDLDLVSDLGAADSATMLARCYTTQA